MAGVCQRPPLTQQRAGRVHVEPPGHPGVAQPLPLARRGDHARPDRGARLGLRRRAGSARAAAHRGCGSTNRVMSMRSAMGPEILRAVLAALHLPARALVVAGVGVVGPAPARVAGEDEHRPGRVGGVLVAPRDRDLPGLERLPQRLDDVGGEERELVEEQHPEVGLADLTGTDPPAAAAEDAGAGGRVVRRPERRTRQAGGTGRQGAAERVHRGQLERLVVG